MKQKNIWKPLSIILAVIIALCIIGTVVLLLFGGKNKISTLQKTTKATELTETFPSKKEMKTVSSITISTQNMSEKTKENAEEKTEKAEERKSTSTESHRYEVINTRMTWTEAKSYCENLGGYLATIESQEEYNKIVQLANASGRKVLWLGAQKNSNQSFEWVTGEAFEYSNWLSGEPNNEGGNENCLVMFLVNDQWVWADVPNDISSYYAVDTVGFVCEYDE